jgi:pyruvate/2-oxoglutarate dehydrogenase complex dihydrolipoamide dehydrogenase (E3) component
MTEIVRISPDDEFNRELAANVHPSEWTNPVPAGRYHLVVIGAGTAGLVTAAGAAGLGAKVALIERNLMGGDCLNVGCVPSKSLLAAARAAAATRDARRFGVKVPPGTRVDFPEVMRRMRKLRAKISHHDSAERFRRLGVDVFFGQARFLDSRSVEVDGTRLDFKRAVIATGSRPAIPPISGLDEVGYLTNESLFSLTELPRRLGIIGGGPIGCEMAQAFARFGAEVTLVESSGGILPREDRDAAEIVQQALEGDGVRLLCGADQVAVRSGSEIHLTVDSGERSHEQPVDRLLVSAGRRPNVEGLNLEAAGVAVDSGGVRVDDRLRTTNRRIYAAGDVCSSLRFTHAADFMARIVIRNALFLGRRRVSSLLIPWCTYTSPEIAHVGLSTAQAAEQGSAVDCFVQPLREVDRAVLDGDEAGFVKVLVRKGTDKIVGATIVAPHAGDLIGELTLAMTHGLGLKAIADTIHPYPTQAEAIRKLGDQFNRSRLTPLVKTLFQQWLSWTR